MTSITDIFRLQLGFVDGLKLVHAVAAPAIVSGAAGSASVMLKGPEDLAEFLVAVGIDSYLVTSGDPCFPATFTCTLHIAEPTSIVQNLKRRFDDEAAIQLKIISGESVCDSELSAKIPGPITLWAQSVTTSEGLNSTERLGALRSFRRDHVGRSALRRVCHPAVSLS
jgi:hypothetical protein